VHEIIVTSPDVVTGFGARGFTSSLPLANRSMVCVFVASPPSPAATRRR
jgi:hypothetical protein